MILLFDPEVVPISLFLLSKFLEKKSNLNGVKAAFFVSAPQSFKSSKIKSKFYSVQGNDSTLACTVTLNLK